MAPRWTGDYLEVGAPNLHFITGKSLERLRNGAAVPFDFQLTLFAGDRGNAVHRALERFVVSYDLWEERFAVVRLRSFRRSSPHLTATAAEAWCLDNIAIPASVVPSDKPLWVGLEIRSAEPKPSVAVQDDNGISLATLIEIFSRPTRSQQDRWVLETGPFKLSDLRRQHAAAQE